jgi:two-component system response regulator PilR (NtrC family)
MESEFFGYRKGAFTGADADRDGYFHAAHGGTLFLDEVADLPLAMQVKLLRVIQEKRFRRLGDTAEEAVDVRIISATHQRLPERVAAGAFRHDLFYRLNVIELRMPSLREIAADIPVLAARILERLTGQSGVATPTLTEAAMAALRRHPFAGNVRELENVLERALALSGGERIDAPALRLAPGVGAAVALPAAVPLEQRLDDVERRMVLEALDAAGDDRDAAAKRLGISRRGLELRLTRLGLAS